MKTAGNQKKGKSFFSGYGFPILVFACVIAYTVISYGIEMNSKIREQVYDDYIKDVAFAVNVYNEDLTAIKRVAQLAARHIAESGSTDVFSENAVDIIDDAAAVTGASKAYIVSHDNSAVDNQGNKYDTIDNIAGINEAISEYGNNMVRLATDENGKRKFMVVSPIVEGNSFSGYVVIDYYPTIMETLTSHPRFSNNKSYALVVPDGTVVESCGTEAKMSSVGYNLIESSDGDFSEGSYLSLKQGITNSRTGHVRLKRDGEDKYLFYAPLGSFYANVVMYVGDPDIQLSYKTASSDIKTFVITLGIIMAVIALTIIGIGIFNRTKFHMESEDLQYKADTDQLTDLYNKTATERLIKEYLENEGKDSTSMLFVLDIDNFKKINDTQGHAFGDKVLSSLGHQIKSWFRVNDIIGRIGGDEFIIFIKDIKDPSAVKREGSRIMQFFEGFNVGDYTRYSPTASVGGAVFPSDADDFESLYKAADKAVYKSKREGKNRVSFYSDLDSADKEAEGNSELEQRINRELGLIDDNKED